MSPPGQRRAQAANPGPDNRCDGDVTTLALGRGSHRDLTPETLATLREVGAGNLRLVWCVVCSGRFTTTAGNPLQPHRCPHCDVVWALEQLRADVAARVGQWLGNEPLIVAAQTLRLIDSGRAAALRSAPTGAPFRLEFIA